MTSLAWIDVYGDVLWMHGDQHFKYAEHILSEMDPNFSIMNYHYGNVNRAMVIDFQWIKVSNYLDFAMMYYDEEDREDDKLLNDRLLTLAKIIVECVVSNKDDPEARIVNVVFMGEYEQDRRKTLTPYEAILEFGGIEYGEQLVDYMYENLM
jgi:hypothetical protein